MKHPLSAPLTPSLHVDTEMEVRVCEMLRGQERGPCAPAAVGQWVRSSLGPQRETHPAALRGGNGWVTPDPVLTPSPQAALLTVTPSPPLGSGGSPGLAVGRGQSYLSAPGKSPPRPARPPWVQAGLDLHVPGPDSIARLMRVRDGSPSSGLAGTPTVGRWADIGGVSTCMSQGQLQGAMWEPPAQGAA